MNSFVYDIPVNECYQLAMRLSDSIRLSGRIWNRLLKCALSAGRWYDGKIR